MHHGRVENSNRVYAHVMIVMAEADVTKELVVYRVQWQDVIQRELRDIVVLSRVLSGRHAEIDGKSVTTVQHASGTDVQLFVH